MARSRVFTARIRLEIKALTRLAIPVVLAQVGSMTLGLVDMAMVGKLGKDALSAVSLGDVWVFGTLIAGIAIVMGIDPIVSQAHGAGKGKLAGLALQRGAVIGVLLNIPIGFLWWNAGDALKLLGQSPSIVEGAQTYTSIQIFSIAPFLIFTVFRQYLQGRGIMMVPLLIIVAANVMNVFFNWTLIYGNLGVPALGIKGAGIATGLTRTFMMIALLVVVWRWRLHREAWQPWSKESFSFLGLWQVLRYGIPIAVMYCMEVWAFSASSLLAGLLPPKELNVSSHTVVLKLASFSFMVPLGISIAASTRIGNLLGSKRKEDAQLSAWIALSLGAIVMLGFSGLFVLLRNDLPRLFIQDAEVIALAATILPIAAAFQLFDGTQAVAAGILRGMGRTLPAAIFNLIAFYGLGLPIALLLSFPESFPDGWLDREGIGLEGIWWGLCCGLAVVAFLQVFWIWRRGPSTVSKLAVD